MQKCVVLTTSVVLFLFSQVALAQESIVSHAISLRGAPKYSADFTHFDYVNPDAPKGGTITMHAIGTYDSFNQYAQGGNWDAGVGMLYDSLITPATDEVDVYYGLIAETLEYAADDTWILFHLNPNARFQDGTPITADDVVFTFNKFLTEGVPFFKQSYETVKTVEALDERRVKFTLSESDKERLIAVGTLPILPKHYWESRDFSKPTTEVPLGSGPMAVSDYKVGQYSVYKRLENYWAKDLPVMKGQVNFDFIRYDYYRDENVAFEAFKAGEYDFRQENVSKNWATQYTGSQFDKGYIIKEEIPHEIPQGMQCFAFNVQRPLFQDRRVREAVIYALDFEWMNKNLFYDQYTRTRSYFQNTKYEAKGLPGEEELNILEPFRGKIPEEVFTSEYTPPITDGSGNIRPQIRQALQLLKDSGWEIQGDKLVNSESGMPFEFELLLYTPTMERIAIPIQQNLARMGITMNIRVVDTSQFNSRLRSRDFDMISTTYPIDHHPGPYLKRSWRSDYIDSTWNTAGVQDAVVDALVDGIEANLENEELLLHYGRALDRVLMWNQYVIPEWHISKFRVAYWNKFAKPEVRPKYDLGFFTWWIDSEKEAQLPSHKTQ